MRLAFALAAVVLAAPLAAQPATLAADVEVGASGMGGQGDGPFTLFSLAENRVVPAADSASTAWDLGFRGTTVIVNGGTSGPGAAAAAIVEADFEDVISAEDALLVADGDRACPRGEPLAVCTGSGNGWYLYAENGVTPLPGRTLVVRTAAGALAKVRFLAYRLGEPGPDGGAMRYYTFEHAPLAAAGE